MKYAHILRAVASEIWAMDPDKLAAIVDFLAVKADGAMFTAEEIEARIAPQTARAVARREGSVAVIPVRGVIASRASMMTDISSGGGASSEAIDQAVKAALADDDVKAIVLDIDSPGGNALGVDEAAARIFEARGTKPIVAQVNATAASAAYWLASAAQEIVVTPSGMVGSIGVYTVHEDVSAALEKLGVKRTLIGAGKFKGEGVVEALTEEAIAARQNDVDTYYGMFVDRVAAGRGVKSQDVRDGFGQGRVVLAAAAVAQGMADRVGTLDETLSRFGVSPTPATATRANAPARRMRAALI